jgi:CBS domain containing-hemolysin-like protein
MSFNEFVTHSYKFAGLLLLLCCSAFFSGSETALFSLTRQDLRWLERSSTRSARHILHLVRSPQTLLGAILFGNMIVNVAFYSLSFLITMQLSKTSRTAAAVSGVAALFAVILFGEVSPKGIAVGRPLQFSRLVAPVLYGYTRAVYPISAILHRIAQAVTGFVSDQVCHVPYVTRNELKMLVGMAEQQGVLERDTRVMIQQVVELATIRANEVMEPRVDVPMFNIAAGRKALRAMIRQTYEDRILVYEGSKDKVLGLVVSRDVFLHPEADIRSLVRSVRYVPETQTVESLLRQFRETKDPLAVVVDEYGGTAGLVNQEHILEEVVGEIRDEYEPVETPVSQINEDTYVLAGDLNTRDWRQMLGVSFDPQGVDTVGGFVTALLGHIPSIGERVEWRGLSFSIERMAGRRVDLVRVERINGEGQ